MTYSLGYDEYDPEIIRAKAIAKHLGIPNKTIYFKEIIQNQSLFVGIQENIKHL
jgi:DNA-binding XRE family transcriptional regulator